MLSLMKQVAVAVAYTHANKLAHMDIKPQNILLDETKTLAKLCDFGCAYFLQSSIRSSMARRFLWPLKLICAMSNCAIRFGWTFTHLVSVYFI